MPPQPTQFVATMLDRRSRRRVLAGLAGGAGLLLVGRAAGGLAPLAAAQEDEEDSGRDDSGHGDGDGGDRDGGDHGDDGGADGEDVGDALSPAVAVPAGTALVEILDDDGYTPPSVTVDPGQPIAFVNRDGDDHTATGSGFDTGLLPEGGGMATVVLDEPGTYRFTCQFHPNMVGTIGVRGPDGTVPPPVETAPPPAGATTVTIANLAFSPATITVPTGTTVAWTNDDSVPHTVTALDGGFDSGIFDPGAGFSRAFGDPGTFDYRCNVHPEMLGSVVVEGDPVAVAAEGADAAPASGDADAVGAAADAPADAADADAADADAADADAAQVEGDQAAAPAAGVAEATVAIVDFAFEPAALEVAAGTTVVWTNTGQAPHTVTGEFADSGTLEPGQTFRHTFAETGAFDYVCAFHPQMVAQVRVGAPDTAGAPPAAAEDEAPAGGAAGDETAADAVAAGAVGSQADGETARPGGEIVGAWRVGLTPDGAEDELVPQQGLVTFHADGTVAADFAAAGSAADGPTQRLGRGQGAWREDGAGGYRLSLVTLIEDADGGFAGTLTIRETGRLDAGGDAYQGAVDFEVAGADGSVLATGNGTTRGSRVRAEPAATPETSSDPAAASEPAAVAEAPATTDEAPAVPADQPVDAGAPPDAAADAPAAPAAPPVVVTIRDFAFEPATLEVPVGATVAWENADPAPHTATTADGAFDTGRLDQGQSATATFGQAGTFPYGCLFHPNMRATLVVA